MSKPSLVELKDHPAKFGSEILQRLSEIVLADALTKPDAPYHVLDPMAGTGLIHRLANPSFPIITHGIEIEPEWALYDPRTVVGDCMDAAAIFGAESMNAIVTSPVYGNRMSDLYDGRDGSKRHTYRISLGRKPTEGSSAGMQWGNGKSGDKYRAFHQRAWAAVTETLKPGGIFVLNIKDHIRHFKVQPVTHFHLQTLLDLGYAHVKTHFIATSGNRHGQNGDARTNGEHIIIMRKG